MWKMYTLEYVHSDKNGDILVKHLFGHIEILVNGYYQSGEYMRKLWKRAVRRVPHDQPVHQILMLGLGGGSSLNDLHARFPEAKLTIIEWDPVMVELSKKLGYFDKALKPTILIGDAVDLIPQLTETFDLILIDLFNGPNPEPRLSSSSVISSITRVLAPNSLVILNIFKAFTIIEAFSQQLHHEHSWWFRQNRLASFRRKPYKYSEEAWR